MTTRNEYQKSNQELATAKDESLFVRPGNMAFANGYYTNIDPSISVRAPMTRDHYNYFRPEEAVGMPRTQDEYRRTMSLTRSAYERVGVIRSVIDMMSEFGAEGIRIVHEDKVAQEFYDAWSKKVKLPDRAERFLSWLYKSGNTAVRRKFGVIDTANLSGEKSKQKKASRIPLEYIFYDPATLEILGGSFSGFSDKKLYGLRLPFRSLDGIKQPKNELEKKVFDALPDEIKQAIGQKEFGKLGLLVVPIPEDKIYVAHYKKDDCDMWAKSFIFSIMEDVFYNDKLKLAKTSGLDGWYNVIRLWKLGDHKEKLLPSPDLYTKLASILQQNTGGGAADIIWRSDISYEDHYPPVDKLVNFEENIDNILLGLGVPQGLIGGKAQGSTGMTNNYLGLKNLIKRLEAGRRALTEWLDVEIDIIQKEMGFRKRPYVTFSKSDLYDERTYFNLLVQLLDRGVLSDETILDRVGEIFDIEKSRMQSETEMRDSGELPEKAGPFYKPDLEQQQKHELKKIRLTKQLDNENGNNSSNTQRSKPKEVTTPGRPNGVRDKVTRRRGGNKSMAAYIIDAVKVYDKINDYLNQQAFTMYGISTARQLTTQQIDELDKAKLAMLGIIAPFTEITDEYIANSISKGEGPVGIFKDIYAKLVSESGLETLTNEQKKLLRVQAYAESWYKYENL